MIAAGAGLWTSDNATGGGGGPPLAIIYRPGGVTSAPVYATWAEVYAAFQASEGQITIQVDATLAGGVAPVPVGAYDFEHRAGFNGTPQGFPQATTLDVADGATIANLAALTAIHMRINATTAPALSFTSTGWIFAIRDGGYLINAGTQPACDVAANTFGAIGIQQQGGYNNQPGNGAPIARIGGGAALVVNSWNRPILDLTAAGELVSSLAPGDGVYIPQKDGTWPGDPANPNFSGITQPLPPVSFDSARWNSYTDTAPLLGADNVQAAIDALKAATFPAFPVSDAVFAIEHAADATKILQADLSGQAAATTTTITTTAQASRPFRLPDLSGTALVSQDVTGLVLINTTTQLHGSNAGIQYATGLGAGQTNRAQLRCNLYGAHAGSPGATGFKSRALAIGGLAAVLPGDPLYKITAIGVAPDNASIPLAALVTIQVPAAHVPNPADGWQPAEFEIQLTPDQGPTNNARRSFRVTSEGEAQTLRGVRAGGAQLAGGPPFVQPDLSLGSLWTSGQGDPNVAALVGAVGDLYTDQTGAPGAVLWVCEAAGVGGWAPK